MMRIPGILTLLPLAGSALAATLTYNWDIDWVTAAPDGFARPVVGINGKWPCPKMEATVGDTVVVNLRNNLGNETTGMHFHGIRQYGSPEMDGPVSATQCSIPPGKSLTYQFKVCIDVLSPINIHLRLTVSAVPRSISQAHSGTTHTRWASTLTGYEDHSLSMIQRTPARARFQRNSSLLYQTGEYTLSRQTTLPVTNPLRCRYHNQSIPLVQQMLQPSNTLFIPPIPDSIIVNEGGSSNIPVEKGKTYRIRIINFSALASAMINFKDHTMKIVMQDGSYITPAYAQQIRVTPAQRYDVLLTPNVNDTGNYPFLVALDINPDYTRPGVSPLPVTWNYNQTGYLLTDPSAPATSTDVISAFNVIDDSKFSNLNHKQAALGPVTQTIQLDFNFCFDNNSIPRACFNGKPYVDQDVPTLYSVATTGTANTNPIVYGQVNPFIVAKGAIVELVVNNLDVATHPFHLHGHQFQVISRPASGAGTWPGSGAVTVSAYPASKDTVAVQGNSYAVIRFAADNPGTWLFHCHIEWHVEMGLTATIIEAPEEMRGLAIPGDQIEVCKAQGLPYRGNAAGNTVDYTNTSGMNFVNPAVYTG